MWLPTCIAFVVCVCGFFFVFFSSPIFLTDPIYRAVTLQTKFWWRRQENSIYSGCDTRVLNELFIESSNYLFSTYFLLFFFQCLLVFFVFCFFNPHTDLVKVPFSLTLFLTNKWKQFTKVFLVQTQLWKQAWFFPTFISVQSASCKASFVEQRFIVKSIKVWLNRKQAKEQTSYRKKSVQKMIQIYKKKKKKANPCFAYDSAELTSGWFFINFFYACTILTFNFSFTHPELQLSTKYDSNCLSSRVNKADLQTNMGKQIPSGTTRSNDGAKLAVLSGSSQSTLADLWAHVHGRGQITLSSECVILPCDRMSSSLKAFVTELHVFVFISLVGSHHRIAKSWLGGNWNGTKLGRKLVWGGGGGVLGHRELAW